MYNFYVVYTNRTLKEKSMKNYFKVLFTMLTVAMFGVFASALAFAADVLPQPVSSDEFLAALLGSLGGFKGASTLVIVGIVTQLAMKLLMTKVGDFAGKWKITIVLTLSIVVGVVGLMSTEHLTLLAALLHSTTLAAFQVLGHQLLVQFSEKEAAPASPPAAA
jgi:hypothetical protein